VQFKRVCVPAGIDIGSETAEEIAASIAAELIAIRKDLNIQSIRNALKKCFAEYQEIRLGVVIRLRNIYWREIMKLSARNVLKGKVKKVIVGAVNSEVVLELSKGVEIVSIITKESAENLKLAEGKDAYAVIKASNVMIAID
jgi:molybdopterin-binding protein